MALKRCFPLIVSCLFFSTPLHAQVWSEYDVNIDFCNEVEEVNGQIQFGKMRLTINDKNNGNNVSTSEQLDLDGIVINLDDDSPFSSLTHLRNTMIRDAAVSSERPVEIIVSKSQPSKTIKVQPCVAYSNESHTFVGPNYDARTFSEIAYWQARYIRYENEPENTVSVFSDQPKLSAWLAPINERPKRFFYTVFYDPPLGLKARYFAYKGVKGDVDRLANETGVELAFGDTSIINTDNAGFTYKWYNPFTKNETYTQNVIPESDMIVIEHGMQIDTAKPVNEQLREFVERVKLNAIYLSNMTDQRLNIAAFESHIENSSRR